MLSSALATSLLEDMSSEKVYIGVDEVKIRPRQSV